MGARPRQGTRRNSQISARGAQPSRLCLTNGSRGVRHGSRHARHGAWWGHLGKKQTQTAPNHRTEPPGSGDWNGGLGICTRSCGGGENGRPRNHQTTGHQLEGIWQSRSFSKWVSFSKVGPFGGGSKTQQNGKTAKHGTTQKIINTSGKSRKERKPNQEPGTPSTSGLGEPFPRFCPQRLPKNTEQLVRLRIGHPANGWMSVETTKTKQIRCPEQT